MPLKIYNTEAEVPTEHKGFYAPNASGKWEPQVEGVQSISGLISKKDELLGKVSGHATELQTKQTEIDRLNGELANARSAATLPRGHRAVPTADADLIDAVKAAGVTTVESLNTLKTEHADYKQKAETAERAKHAAGVGEAMGWDKEKTGLLVPAVFDLSQVEIRDGADGKKEAVAKVKQGDVFVEKPFSEVIKATPALSALLPSLTAQQSPTGTPLPEHGAGGGSGGEDLVTKRLNAMKTAQAANPNPLLPKPAAQAAA